MRYDEVIRMLDLNSFLLRFYWRDRDVRRLVKHAILHARLLWLRGEIEREAMSYE